MIAAIDTVIVASGGLNKAPVIAAVLRAKLASVLVSDEKTAAEALRLFRAASPR